jgi:hypothetical protein
VPTARRREPSSVAQFVHPRTKPTQKLRPSVAESGQWHDASLTRGGVLAALTLSIDWRLRGGEGRSPTFLAAGARISGLYGPPLGDWSLASGEKASDEPKLGLRGGFVALALGFGAGPVKH